MRLGFADVYVVSHSATEILMVKVRHVDRMDRPATRATATRNWTPL